MHYAFQDKENVYLIMDYLGGGDLRYHIIKYFKFDEEKTSNFKIVIILQPKSANIVKHGVLKSLLFCDQFRETL